MARNYRQFPRKKGPVLPAASVPTGTPETFPSWRHKREQDNAHQPNYYRRKRQQPIVNEGWIKTPNSTVALTPANDPSLWIQPKSQPIPRKSKKIEITGGAISNVVEAPYLSYYKQPTNQPLRSRTPKRQQPIVAEGWLNKASSTTTTSSATIPGQIRIAINPAIEGGLKQPTNQPLSSKFYTKRRLQPPSAKLRPLITVANTANLSGQIRISENPSNIPDSWLQQVNQPLRSRVPKRQQPFAYNKRFLVTSANSSTLAGQIRIALNPSTKDGFIQQVNQPLSSKLYVKRRLQPPSAKLRPLFTFTPSATISGQIRIAENPSTIPDSWLQQVNQPLRSRLPKRQQPPASKFRPLVTTSTSATISGQIRVSENPSLIPDSWLQQVNQPLRSRIPKRQQPFPINKRFLITSANQATISGQIRIATNPTLNPVYKQQVNQPLRSRVPKRQQPFAVGNKRFLTTANTSANIAGQIRIATNPAFEPVWKQLVNQPLKSRNPKRQQPQASKFRPLVTVSTSATISGQIRVSENPSLNPESWIQPKSQLPKNRIPKRQQPFAYENRRFLVTTYGTIGTISGQIRIATNPSVNPVYKHLVNQPLKNRVPKRLQPFAVGNKRFLTTANSLATITGQIRISENPSNIPDSWLQDVNQPLSSKHYVKRRLYPPSAHLRPLYPTSNSATISGRIRIAENPSRIPDSWLQPVNQPLRSRVPKRQQPFAIKKRFIPVATGTATIAGHIRIVAPNIHTYPAVTLAKALSPTVTIAKVATSLTLQKPSQDSILLIKSPTGSLTNSKIAPITLTLSKPAVQALTIQKVATTITLTG